MVRGKQGEGGARIEERMRKREDLATPMSREIVGRHRSLVGTLLLFALVGQAHAFSAPGLCGKFTLRPCVARKGVPRSSTKLSHPSKPKTYRLRRSEMLRMGPVEQVDAGRLEEQLKVVINSVDVCLPLSATSSKEYFPLAFHLSFLHEILSQYACSRDLLLVVD
eukprot:749927-Hanusia_phi.AAC.9